MFTRMLHWGFALLAFAYVVRLTCDYDGQIAVAEGACRTITTKKRSIEIKLDSFDAESYSSLVSIDCAPPETVSPNHPEWIGLWQIYQSSFMEMPGGRKVSILGISHDVSMPFALLGGVFLLLGALWPARWPHSIPREVHEGFGKRCGLRRFFAGRTGICGVFLALALAFALCAAAWRTWQTGRLPLGNVYEFVLASAVMLPVVALSGGKPAKRDVFLELLLFGGLFAMDGTIKPLPPALQSPFFVPHVGAYVLGYVLALRSAILLKTDGLRLAFAFMTAGMLLGAAWAQICWGRWWSFDPKETFSLATWLVCAAVFHAKEGSGLQKILLAATGILVLLTLSWVNFSRMFASLHTYAA